MATTPTASAAAALTGANAAAAPSARRCALPRHLPAARRTVAYIRCSAVSPAAPLRYWGPTDPRKGADILVEALERCGVSDVFAYPGGASMEIHQALTRSPVITNHLFRHEQGEAFAASGYARASGRVGVCVATSGPGATNLVSALADALLDSVPMVAITGQVPRRMIGTDAFQETPIVEVTRSITKHNYLVLDVDDIPRVVQEAFFLASSGRPGPVLVDIPKDIQQQMAVPTWDMPMSLPGYIARLPKPPATELLEQVLRLVDDARRPVLYVGGGCAASGEEMRRFVELTGIPVTTTLMGLGNFPSDDPLSLRMLGMHGTVYANYAVDKADLLLAFGVRFDDRVTGKIEAFASRAKIVHIDIDPAEIGKNKQPHVSICADVKLALQGLNALLEGSTPQKTFDFAGAGGYDYDMAGYSGGGAYYTANDRYPAAPAAYEDPLAGRRQHDFPAPLTGLEFQPSDTCPKNYVIFDQTYDRSRVMFHPSLANNFGSSGGGYDYDRHHCYGFDQNYGAYYGCGDDGGGSIRQKEDTDEIDALMSTEDGEDEDDVLSTGRTPGCRAGGSPDSTCSSGCGGGGRKHETGGGCGGEKKKERMKKMVRTLKGIIPGGDRMDTPAVLDEAVRYLKSLKVEVKKLGARGSSS